MVLFIQITEFESILLIDYIESCIHIEDKTIQIINYIENIRDTIMIEIKRIEKPIYVEKDISEHERNSILTNIENKITYYQIMGLIILKSNELERIIITFFDM